MKGRKLVISLVLALAFSFALTCGSVFAYDFDDVNLSKCKSINIGEWTKVSVSDSNPCVTFRFTPDEDGTFILSSKDSEDTKPNMAPKKRTRHHKAG